MGPNLSVNVTVTNLYPSCCSRNIKQVLLHTIGSTKYDDIHDTLENPHNTKKGSRTNPEKIPILRTVNFGYAASPKLGRTPSL